MVPMPLYALDIVNSRGAANISDPNKAVARLMESELQAKACVKYVSMVCHEMWQAPKKGVCQTNQNTDVMNGTRHVP